MLLMRALFLSAQMPGHLDWGGYLQTAKEMARHGHEVLWASGTEVQSQVTSIGIPFRALAATGWRWPPPPPLAAGEAKEGASTSATNAENLQLLKQQRALDQWLDVARVTRATEEIAELGREFKPDLLLSEMFVAASGLAAEMLDVPLFVAGWPAPPPAQAASGAESLEEGTDDVVALARVRLRDLLAHFRLSGRNWTEAGLPALLSPHLHLTYWSPSWFEGVRTRQQTQHVGGIAPQDTKPPPADLPPVEDAPWVLITLGTSFNRDPNFFINAAHAARRMGCLPIVVFGSNLSAPWIRQTMPRLPKTAAVREHIDFSAVLPHVSAAIHHGGAGTTHALVVYGIPQLVIPHAADQLRQAHGVMRTGVGMHVAPRNATVDALVACLSQLLPDRSEYRTHARALQDEFHALGGVPAAAELLEQVYAQLTLPKPSSTNAQREDTSWKP